MDTISQRSAFFGSIIVAMALGGCAATPSKVRVDKADVDLSKCRTFDWLPASSDAASFTEQRVRSETMRQLEEKGYAISADEPDCRITYVLSAYERPRSKPSVGVGAGGGSGGVGGGIGVNLPIGRKGQYGGTFTLDVIDASRNAQIWSGAIQATFKAREINADEAREVVGKVLAEFPDRAPDDQR